MNKIAQIFGEVRPPATAYGDYNPGLSNFITVILRTMIVIAGIYAVFNFVLAGYAFLSAGDDSKKVAGAWAKIWQSVLGLAFAAGAFVLGEIFGRILFGPEGTLLQLKIFTP